MKHRVIGKFEVVASEESDIRNEPAQPTMSRGRVEKRYSGDVVGTGVAYLLMSRALPEGAGYTALERIQVAIDGTSGSFDLIHGGIHQSGTDTAFGYIVPGTGRDGFTGITGTGFFRHDAQGAFIELEYELPNSGA